MLPLPGDIIYNWERAEPLIPRENGVELKAQKLPRQKRPGDSDLLLWKLCTSQQHCTASSSNFFLNFAPLKENIAKKKKKEFLCAFF